MAKILLVDDNENTIKLVTSILTNRGHLVVSCDEARGALDYLSREHFDLLVTDVMMPGGVNGFDLVRTVRATPKMAMMPTVIITGRREKKDIEQGIEVGADDYVVKPIDPEILASKVASLLINSEKFTDTFASGATKAPAVWDMKTEVVRISEIGMDIASSIPLTAGMKVRLKTPLFSNIGIEAPMLRVVSCNFVKNENHYVVAVHFVGLTEKEMVPLRMWIRASKLSKGA